MEISTLRDGMTRKNDVFTKLNMALLTAIFLFVTGLSLNGQAIRTDKVDYMPGDTVRIEGLFWEPFETIDVLVKETVLNPAEPVVSSKTFTCDFRGRFEGDLYYVIQADLGAFFQVEATGGTSGHVCTTVFNDAGGDYGIDYSGYDPQYYDRVLYYDYIQSHTLPSGNEVSPLAIVDQIGVTRHDKTVESLMPTHLGLGQIVAFEFFIRVDAKGSCFNDVVQFSAEWSTVTTNTNPFGFDGELGVVAAFVDASDDPFYIENVNGTLSSASVDWNLVGNTIVGDFTVTGLDPGDEIPVEVWLVLQQSIEPGTGGNVPTNIVVGSLATVGGCEEGKINSGNQTVPLLQTEDFLTNDVDLDITKVDNPLDGYPDEPFTIGDYFTYTINLTNNGPSVANSVVVTDELDPNVTYVSHVINDTEGSVNWVFSQDGQVLTFQGDPNMFLNIGESVSFDVTVQVSDECNTGDGFTEAADERGGYGTVCDADFDLCNVVHVTTISDDINLANNDYHEPTGLICPTISIPDLNATPTSCNGDSDGTITGTITGGVPDYTVVISGASLPEGYPATITLTEADGDSFTFNDLPAGTYQIVVTDVNNCDETFVSITINEPPPLVVDLGNDASTCGGSEVTLTPNVTGGVAPYAFLWSTGATTTTITVGPGTYSVTVTDANSCTATDEIIVTQDADPECSITGATPVCPSTTGEIYTGPIAPEGDTYIYVWTVSEGATIVGGINNEQTVTLDFGASCDATITLSLTVTNDAGCEATCEYSITIDDTTDPEVTPPTGYTLEGCDESAITEFVYSEEVVTVTLTEYLALAGSAASDNCGIASVTYQDAQEGSCPIEVTRTWVITDECDNATTVYQTINIDDTTPPTFECPNDLTIYCDFDGIITIPKVADDNCSGIVPVRWYRSDNQELYNSDNYDEVTDIIFPVGITTITFTATDDCGNTSECEMTVTVEECGYIRLDKRTIVDGNEITGIENVQPDWYFTVHDGLGFEEPLETDEWARWDNNILFDDYVLSLTKNYTVCEHNVPSGWATLWTVDKDHDQFVEYALTYPTDLYNPNSDDDPPEDFGNRCFEIGPGTGFELIPTTYSERLAFQINVVNQYPGGSPRTPGYWKNWTTCSGGGQQFTATDNSVDQDGDGDITGIDRILSGWALLDDVLNPSIGEGISWGDFQIRDIVDPATGDLIESGCVIGTRILSAYDADGTNRNSDAAYTLAKHLLAYQANMGAGAYVCHSDDDSYDMGSIETWAEELLVCIGFNGEGEYLRSGDDYYNYALTLANILDQYNNGMPCEGFDVVDENGDLTGEHVDGLDELIAVSGIEPVSFPVYVYAGEDGDFCSDQNHLQIEGSAAYYRSILWTDGDSEGDFADGSETTLNPIYYLNGSTSPVTLTMTVSGCGEASADVTFTPLPEVTADAGPELYSDACPTSITFEDASASGGNITWAATIDYGTPDATPGDGTWVGGVMDIAQPTYEFGPSDIDAGQVTFTLTVENDCGVASDNVVVTLQPDVTAFAGTNQDICYNLGSYTLDEAIATNFSAVTWSIISGSGKFDVDPINNPEGSESSNQLQPTYTFALEDEGTTVQLMMAVDGNCNNAAISYVDLNLIPDPTAEILNGDAVDWCFGNAYELDGSASAFSDILWTDGEAIGEFVWPEAEDTEYWFNTGKKVPDGESVTLTMTVSNECGADATDEIVLTHYKVQCRGNAKDLDLIGENAFFLTSVSGYPALDMDIRVFPNPFEHNAFVEVTPLQNTALKIEVFSVTGQQLEVLHDGEVTADREYTFEFDGTRYPYTTFLVRVTTTNGVGTGQIIKIK